LTPARSPDAARRQTIILKIVPPPGRGNDAGAWLRIAGVGAAQLLQVAARKGRAHEVAGIEASPALKSAVGALADDVESICGVMFAYAEAGSPKFEEAPTAARLDAERTAPVGIAPARASSPELEFVVAALKAML